MALPLLTIFPQSITSGDTTRLQLSLRECPASTYTATLILNQAGVAAVTCAGTASGDNFLFTITAAQSSAMLVGAWTWQARATQTSSGDVTTGAAGDFIVLANPASTLTKSNAQQQLDAANAALLLLAGNPDAVTNFNGQSITSVDIPKMIAVVRNLKALVAEEKNEASGLRGDAPSRSIRPYFR